VACKKGEFYLDTEIEVSRQRILVRQDSARAAFLLPLITIYKHKHKCVTGLPTTQTMYV
jgi:hypothetical protein